MKKLSGGKIALIVVAAVLVIGLALVATSYNSLVNLQTGVEQYSSDIDTQLQRRMDLIPNLVATVKGYTSHEAEVMANVSDARARLAGAGSMAEKADANAELTGALSRLLMVAENYPDLKADSQYTALMDELAGTENRIAVSRKDYNAAVKTYNKKVRTFPSNLFAGMFGFEQAEYFEAAAGSETPPTVDFTD